MDHASTAAAYDQLAERWLDHRFGSLDGVAQHRRALAFLADADADADGGWALEAGCGCNTRFRAPLRAHGLQVEGVDLSARMVALARAADPAATIHHADLCRWPIPRTYRFISAWDSLWHVRLQAQRPLLLALMAALEPGGVLLLSAGGRDAPDEHVDASMGPAMYYATLGIPGLLAVTGEGGCLLRHLEFDQRPQDHLVLITQRAG